MAGRIGPSQPERRQRCPGGRRYPRADREPSYFRRPGSGKLPAAPAAAATAVTAAAAVAAAAAAAAGAAAAAAAAAKCAAGRQTLGSPDAPRARRRLCHGVVIGSRGIAAGASAQNAAASAVGPAVRSDSGKVAEGQRRQSRAAPALAMLQMSEQRPCARRGEPARLPALAAAKDCLPTAESAAGSAAAQAVRPQLMQQPPPRQIRQRRWMQSTGGRLPALTSRLRSLQRLLRAGASWLHTLQLPHLLPPQRRQTASRLLPCLQCPPLRLLRMRLTSWQPAKALQHLRPRRGGGPTLA